MAWLAWIQEQTGKKGLEMGKTTDPGSTGAKNIMQFLKQLTNKSYAVEANLVYTGPDQLGLHSTILCPLPHKKKGSGGRWSLHLSMS